MKAFQISPDSQELVANLLVNIDHKGRLTSSNVQRLRDADLAYQREENLEVQNKAAAIANRYGAASKFQDVTVPIVMPQVETAVSYQQSVFLAGTPLFPIVASPKHIDAAMQLETIIDNQAIKGKWVSELLTCIKDGMKYNLMAAEVTWEDIATAEVEVDSNIGAKLGKPKHIIWSGNVIKRWDLYNTFWDTSVAPRDIASKGEYVGNNELVSKVALIVYLNSLKSDLVMNREAALESAYDSSTYYVPDINPDSYISSRGDSSGDWDTWVGISSGVAPKNGTNRYLKTILYVRLIPKGFKITAPAPDDPQVWKFIIINRRVVVYAERQTNAHELLPVIFASPMEDGLGYQTKSFAENVKPIQQVASALMNSVIAGRRRSISDRTLYDPNLIDSKHINSPNPSAKIPVKARAYGKSLSDAVYPFPYNDTQSVQVLQELPHITKFADSISGQNQASQGQFTKGNRTRHEYADIASNSNGRNQLIAITLEANFFTSIKEILKLNVLQFQGTASVYSRDAQTDIAVDPIALRKAIMSFKVADGLIPTDTIMSMDAFQTTLQTLLSSPQLGQGYNITPMFSYLMKTQGAEIQAFEKPPEQLQFEQAIQTWQQAIMSLAEANPDIKPEQFPPQPKPTDYGLDEEGKVLETGKAEEPTILQQLTGDQSE